MLFTANDSSRVSMYVKTETLIKSCVESFMALPTISESQHGTGVKSTSVPDGYVF